MTEQWRDIDGFPWYQVSDHGRVRSRASGEWKIRRLVPHRRHGYLTVMLSRHGKKRLRFVHALVAVAFMGPPPPQHETAHINGIATDNRVSNLAYKTHADNEADKVLHGTIRRGERHGSAVLSDAAVIKIREAVAAGAVQRRVAEEFGISYAHVSDIVRRKKRAQ